MLRHCSRPVLAFRTRWYDLRGSSIHVNIFAYLLIKAIFMGCFLQVWYILASFVTWYTIDRVGRRFLFISMALGMCLVLVLEAVMVAIGGGSGATGPGVAAVVFVFLYLGCFTWGWMATVWIYPPEILPLKIRAKVSYF